MRGCSVNRIFATLCAAALMGGCATASPTPGINAGASLWVAVHEHHSGLIVRADDVPDDAWPARADFPHARYLEVGWGDRAYYTSAEAGVLLGLRALLVPTDSAVHVVAIAGAPERVFPDAEILELRVSREGLQRAIEFVRQTHQFDVAGQPIVLGPGLVPGTSRFYASERRFHLFETCNTWVARALMAAGLPLQPSRAITAGGLARQVRPIALGNRTQPAHLPHALSAVQNLAP
jgi:uncharacterized protein (TIGR02117 family)